MIRAAIFDLDGTLVDSLPGIADGLNGALSARGLPSHPPEKVERFVGNGSWMLVRRGIGGAPSEALVEEVHEIFLSLYAESHITGTHLYPGIRSMLESLHRDGMPLAVCSNKPHRYTVDIISRMFSWVPWMQVLGQKESIPAKPAPTGALSIAHMMNIPPSEVAFVGDSLVDFETGKAAGMQPVLVGWGFTSAEKLKRANAPIVFSVSDLHKFLQAPHRES